LPKKIYKKYTCADYLQWPDEERWELIDGVPYDMNPAPNRKNRNSMKRQSFFLFPNYMEKWKRA